MEQQAHKMHSYRPSSLARASLLWKCSPSDGGGALESRSAHSQDTAAQAAETTESCRIDERDYGNKLTQITEIQVHVFVFVITYSFVLMEAVLLLCAYCTYCNCTCQASSAERV